jgi:tRNA (cmo5U34)-methyltransferase
MGAAGRKCPAALRVRAYLAAVSHVLIIHRVADYDGWKSVFDAAATLRQAAGERSYQVLFDDDDPNRVVHLSSWTSLAAARAFFESDELARVRADAGVESPEFVYLDEVESGELAAPGPAATPTGGWSDPDQVEWYTARIGRLEARLQGEAVLADVLPPAPRRVLDLGCGDGRMADLVRSRRSSVERIVAVDRSLPMLERARERFAGDERGEIGEWDLADPIWPLGRFDVVVSGFAVHHLDDLRKRDLFGEVAGMLEPGGLFANLEVVASSTPARHEEFLAAIGRTANDPVDRLASIGDQLTWMRDAGLSDVDCLWHWRGFALFVGSSAR